MHQTGEEPCPATRLVYNGVALCKCRCSCSNCGLALTAGQTSTKTLDFLTQGTLPVKEGSGASLQVTSKGSRRSLECLRRASGGGSDSRRLLGMVRHTLVHKKTRIAVHIPCDPLLKLVSVKGESARCPPHRMRAEGSRLGREQLGHGGLLGVVLSRVPCGGSLPGQQAGGVDFHAHLRDLVLPSDHTEQYGPVQDEQQGQACISSNGAFETFTLQTESTGATDSHTEQRQK